MKPSKNKIKLLSEHYQISINVIQDRFIKKQCLMCGESAFNIPVCRNQMIYYLCKNHPIK